MSRGISSAVITKLGSRAFEMANVVKIGFSTPVYITDHGHNIDYDGDTYTASSSILSIGSTSEVQEVEVGEVSITLSAVDRAYLVTLLSENWVARDVTINRVVKLDDGSWDTAGTYIGSIVNWGMQNEVIELVIASHWADFERVTGRRSNDASQQAFYPGDTGASRCSEIIKDIKWGRK